MAMLQYIAALKPIALLGAASLIGGGLIWGIQDWRIRGERIETLKVQAGVARDRIAAAVDANQALRQDAERATARHMEDLDAIRQKNEAVDRLRTESDLRRAAARRQRAGEADGPVAPVVLDWLRSMRRPDAPAADGGRPADGADRSPARGATPLPSPGPAR